jgi:hypothetical protein
MWHADKIQRIIEEVENPFDSDKVRKARDKISDVPQIHKTAYAKLQKELATVLLKGESRGVLVTGVAGSGKSHLVARLYRDRPKDVLFFQIQALPGGTHWLKHIVQCVAGELGAPISHESDTPQLNLLVQHFVGAAWQGAPNLPAVMEKLKNKCRRIQDQIPDPIASDILSVLGHLWKFEAPFGKKDQKLRSLIFQWLKGTMIEDDELQFIGAKRNFSSEEGLTNFLTALKVFSTLTVGRAPIILFFDQLDTMEPETVNSLGNQLLTLIGDAGAAPNFLIITAGVEQQINDFIDNRIITSAAADMLFKTRLELSALDLKQCESLVEERLKGAFTPEQKRVFPEDAGPLFPFTPDHVKIAGEGKIMPSARMLICNVRGLYDGIDLEWLENWPDGKTGAPDFPPWEIVSDYLRKEFELRVKSASREMIDDDTLCHLFKRVLQAGSGDPGIQPGTPTFDFGKSGSAAFQITSGTKSDETLVVIANGKGNPSSLSATLKRIKNFLSRQEHRVILIRHFAAKSVATWTKSLEMITGMDQTRFALTNLEHDFSALMALEDLRLAVPDLVVPGTKHHRAYQITDTAYRRFLLESKLVDSLEIIRTAKKLLTQGAEEVAEPIQSNVPDPKAFIWARVAAKKICGVDQLKLDWASQMQKTKLSSEEDHIFERVIELLSREDKLIIVGRENRLLKKV